MRPLYETDADLLRETGVAQDLRAIWECRSEKLPPVSPGVHQIDLRLYRPDAADIFAEVKTRKNPSWKYPTYLISHKKILAGLEHPRAIMVVKFTDQTLWCDMRSPFTVREGGRYDRGDPRDIEQVAHFNIHHFQAVGLNPFTQWDWTGKLRTEIGAC